MPLTDQQIAVVLQGFVRAAGPVLDQLATTGALPGSDGAGAGLLDRARRRMASIGPGAPTWNTLPVAERTDWWLKRVGALVALAGSTPELLGPLQDRTGATAAVQAAGRGLLLCGIAREYGVTDDTRQEALLARVLWGREIRPPADAPSTTKPAPSLAAGGGGVSDLVRAVVRIGRDLGSLIGSVTDELDGLAPRRRRGLTDRFTPVAALRTFSDMRTGLHEDASAAVRVLSSPTALRPSVSVDHRDE